MYKRDSEVRRKQTTWDLNPSINAETISLKIKLSLALDGCFGTNWMKIK